MNAHAATAMTAAQFLRWESRQPRRHEFVDGSLFAMTGGSLRHSLISGRVFAQFFQQIKKPCHVYNGDAKVHIQTATTERFYYPDVTVSCESPKGNALKAPWLIVEVISPSTARVDFLEKRLAYQTLPSLTDYVVCHQKRSEVWHYRRAADWQPMIYTADALLKLGDDAAVGLALPAMYEDLP